MRLKSAAPKPEHLAMRTAVLEALKPYQEQIDAYEILAIMSHVVGQLVALQDQTRFTADQLMTMVAQNIEQGNAEVVQGLTGVDPLGRA